jgi:4'-phosphopantetheinyl transferase
VTAFILLRYALFKEHAITSVPEFVIAREGKPSLKDHGACFNISHSSNVVVCGIGTHAIGVDAQDYTEVSIEIGESVVSNSERNFLRNKKSFSRLWTLKEAYGKFIGSGITYDYKDTDFSEIISSDVVQSCNGLKIYSREFEKYAVSACCEDDIKLIRVQKMQLHEFADALLSKGVP